MSSHSLVNPLSIGVSTAGNSLGNTGLTQVPVVIEGLGVLTASQVSGASQATIRLSVAAGAGGVAAYGVSTGGNTTGTTGTGTGTIVIAAVSGLTASQATAAGGRTVSIIGHSHGVSTDGSGTTGLAPGHLQLFGGNNVTLSQSSDGSGATVSFFGAGSNEVVSRIGVSTGGSTLGDTGTRLGTIVFEGVGGVILSQSTAAGNNGTIRISGAVAQRQASVWVPYEGPNTVKAFVDSGLTVWPMFVQPSMAATQLNLLNNVAATTAVAGTSTITAFFGIYTLSGSTASLASSGSQTYSGSSDGVSLTGNRRYASVALGTWNLTPGQYLMAGEYMTATAGAVGTLNLFVNGGNIAGTSAMANYMGTNVPVTGIWGAGMYSVTTNNLPSSIHVSDVILTGNSASAPVIPVMTFLGTW